MQQRTLQPRPLSISIGLRKGKGSIFLGILGHLLTGGSLVGMNPFPGSDPANSWVIDDDDEQEMTFLDAEVFEVSQRLQEFRQAPPPVIDLGDDGDDDDIVDLENLLEKEIFDLTRDEDAAPGAPAPRRNPEIASVGLRLVSTKWNGMALEEGTVVQMNPNPKYPLRYRYLKIADIYKPHGSSRPSETMIRGLPYIKSMHLGGLLKWRPREVTAVYDVDRDDPRDPEIQACIEVRISDVVAIRTLVTTNAAYPEHNEEGILVCRWKHVRCWPTGKFREAGRTSIHPDYEAAMVSVTPDEADEPFRVSRETLRNNWRGATAKGGSYQLFGGESPTAPINLDEPTQPQPDRTSLPSVRAHGQRYTFFDSFSGAGGASRGAVKAGLRPRFAVDHWQPACKSYKLNFPTAQLFEMNVSDFVVSRVDIRADILHLSPPCQVFSPAHTIASEAKDAANLAALFGCEVVLRKVKPRVFTLEQTFGLMMTRFSPYFNHLVSTFTMHGYSVRWRVVPLANWGLPALRKRLIMIGAGPGERLPPFPEPSHSEDGEDGERGGGLKPFVTARRAINRIRPRRGVDPLHNPRAMKRLNHPPWDADKILPRCITTSGGQNYHFSGTRDLTLREFATLQGFPAYHAFEGPYIKKQIGNAFPPVVAEHLFRHVQNWLLDEDGMVLGEQRPAVPIDSLVIVDKPNAVRDAMIVEDDSESDDDIELLYENGAGRGDRWRGGYDMADGFVEINGGGDVVWVDGLDVDSDDSDRTLGAPRRRGQVMREVLVVD